MHGLVVHLRRSGLLLAALLVLLGLAPSPDPGHLVIIGGGSRPAYMMEKIVELAGGDACRMVVIPMASADPVDVARYQRGQLEEAGCPDVSFVRFDSVTANHDSIVAALDDATGIFFSGGNQNRLTAHMLGTRMLERVRAIHREGGVLAGTSAGAAVMSEIMITGDEALRPDAEYPFTTIERGNVVTAEGFGFVTRAIIDQHFIARQRQNRLISVVLENPELVGVGIDESTAIIISDPGEFQVFGDHTVMVIDASEATGIGTDADADADLVGHGLKLHLLGSGQRYDLVRRRVIQE
ncbi:MAG: cyanophycinase [Gemmatimonadota bacterium]